MATEIYWATVKIRGDHLQPSDQTDHGVVLFIEKDYSTVQVTFVGGDKRGFAPDIRVEVERPVIVYVEDDDDGSEEV